MKVRRILSTETNDLLFRSPRLSEKGYLSYRLWIDEQGYLYVEIVENASGGTFKKNVLLSVDKYASKRKEKIDNLGGYQRPDANTIEFSIKKDETIPVNGNNDEPFFRSILQHLLDGQVT